MAQANRPFRHPKENFIKFPKEKNIFFCICEWNYMQLAGSPANFWIQHEVGTSPRIRLEPGKAEW